MMKAIDDSRVTGAHRRRFADDGYFVLEGAVPGDVLEVARSDADASVVAIEAWMDAAGTDTMGLSRRGQRYSIGDRVPERPELAAFAFGPLMAAVVAATLGPDAWFFGDQHVVKLAERGLPFGWHQDSGYLRRIAPAHDRENLTCWVALDDATADNGALAILPFGRAGGREVIPHVEAEETQDFVGYFGDDPGDLVECPAGSIVVFSTHAFHRSGPNTTDRPRRSWLVQYVSEPCFTPDGTAVGHNLPFLADGQVVAQSFRA